MRSDLIILPFGRWIAASACALLITTACRQQMGDQPRGEVYEASDFFADGMSARPLVPGTVARGHLRTGEPLFTGKQAGQFVADIPVSVDRNVILRGKDRFGIYCSPCHDAAGTGNGIVVQRGYRQPMSYHTDRLRSAAAGYFFDVITNGFGTMPSYAVQLRHEDRWAVVAYIRALQLSQHADYADLTVVEKQRLESEAQ